MINFSADFKFKVRKIKYKYYHLHDENLTIKIVFLKIHE